MPRVQALRLHTHLVEGWKQVIEPFLEAESNQINQYKIFESDENDVSKYMKIGKSKAFFQFSMLIKNLIAIAEIDTTDKKE